jgi:hypothetical protein
VPATLPHHLLAHCLHAPPPLGSPLASPTTRYSPAHNRRSPQHATSSAHCRRFASTRSQRSCPRCTQRTVKVQGRQLRHPSETRCQRRCPSCSDLIACTHRRPSARPSQIPPPDPAPRATAPAHSTQHHQRVAGGSQAPAHSTAAPDARSVPLRSSDVSCAILKRLGASDAAPAALI